MNNVPHYQNDVIPEVLGHMHRRYGNTLKAPALLGDVLGWIESRPRLWGAVTRGGV